MASTISANVDNGTAMKLKVVASLENQSVSDAVSSAITVFVGMPKGVRDLACPVSVSRPPGASGESPVPAARTRQVGRHLQMSRG